MLIRAGADVYTSLSKQKSVTMAMTLLDLFRNGVDIPLPDGKTIVEYLVELEGIPLHQFNLIL